MVTIWLKNSVYACVCKKRKPCTAINLYGVWERGNARSESHRKQFDAGEGLEPPAFRL